MCCYASSLAGAEKAAVEDKAVAAVTRGDSDKPKQVPPNQEGKEEAPMAAAAQPEEQAEQRDVKEVPAGGQQPGGDIKNPPGALSRCQAPLRGAERLFSPRHALLFLGADGAARAGPADGFPSPTQPAEGAMGGSSPAAEGSVPQHAATGGASVVTAVVAASLFSLSLPGRRTGLRAKPG